MESRLHSWTCAAEDGFTDRGAEIPETCHQFGEYKTQSLYFRLFIFSVCIQIKHLICSLTSGVLSLTWFLYFKRRKRSIFSHNCGFVVNIYRLDDGDFSSSDLTEAEKSPGGEPVVVCAQNFSFSVQSELETRILK